MKSVHKELKYFKQLFLQERTISSPLASACLHSLFKRFFCVRRGNERNVGSCCHVDGKVEAAARNPGGRVVS